MAGPVGRLLEEDEQDLTVWDEASTSEVKSDQQADEDAAKTLLGMTGRCHETGVGGRAGTPEPEREKDITQTMRDGEHSQSVAGLTGYGIPWFTKGSDRIAEERPSYRIRDEAPFEREPQSRQRCEEQEYSPFRQGYRPDRETLLEQRDWDDRWRDSRSSWINSRRENQHPETTRHDIFVPRRKRGAGSYRFKPGGSPDREYTRSHPSVVPRGNTKRQRVMSDTFDGKGDWMEYLTHFNAVAELNGWDTEDKKQYLAVCLRGQACNILLSILTEYKRNYHCFVDALTKRFNPGDKTDLFRIQLRNIFRQNQESLPQLAQVIRNLAAKAYPDAKGALLEILSKDHFLDALDDPDMTFKVFQSKTSTLDEAVGIAVELEAFKQAEKHRPGGGWRKNVREIEIGEKTQFGDKESKEGYLESAIEKLTQVMDEMKRDIGTLKGGRSNWSEPMRCWNCGELGHSRKGCKRDTIGDGFTYRPKGVNKDKRSNYKGLTRAAEGQSQKRSGQY